MDTRSKYQHCGVSSIINNITFLVFWAVEPAIRKNICNSAPPPKKVMFPKVLQGEPLGKKNIQKHIGKMFKRYFHIPFSRGNNLHKNLLILKKSSTISIKAVAKNGINQSQLPNDQATKLGPSWNASSHNCWGEGTFGTPKYIFDHKEPTNKVVGCVSWPTFGMI